MEFTILSEEGYDLAKYGFSLSYKDRQVSRQDWMPCVEEDFKYIFEKCTKEEADKIMKRMQHYDGVLKAQAGRGGGHDKFLRQIKVWVDANLPRYLWPELDQYKIATVTQSESTVHTLMRRAMRTSDCVPWTSQASIDAFNLGFPYDSLKAAKANLPEGYLQRRVLTCNYATLENIIKQRTGHRVDDWEFIIDSIYNQAEHPELLPSRDTANNNEKADNSEGDGGRDES